MTGGCWVDTAPSLQEMSRLNARCHKTVRNGLHRAWDAVLSDVRVRPTTDSRDLSELLRTLASPASPLKGFYVAVDRQTNLLRKDDNPVTSKADAALGALGSKASQLSQVFGADAASNDPNDVPGAKVAAHFDSYHKLVDSSAGPAPIDRLLASFGQAQQQLEKVVSSGGGGSVGDIASAGQADVFRGLQAEAAACLRRSATWLAQIGKRQQRGGDRSGEV